MNVAGALPTVPQRLRLLERDFLMFTEQKEELRQMVFDPETKQHHADYISSWKDHQE